MNLEDWKLARYLNSVGKECFVTYFNRFSDWSLSNQEIAELLREERGYTWNACNSRTITSRSFIRAGRAIDALEIVSGSNADVRTREKAAELAKALRQRRHA